MRSALCTCRFIPWEGIATSCRITVTYLLSLPEISPTLSSLWRGTKVAYCGDTAGGENTARNRCQDSINPKSAQCWVELSGTISSAEKSEHVPPSCRLLGPSAVYLQLRLCSSVQWCRSLFQLITHIYKFQGYVDVSILRNVFLSCVPILLNKVFLLPPGIVWLWGGQWHRVMTACVKQAVDTYTVHYRANTAHNIGPH